MSTKYFKGIIIYMLTITMLAVSTITVFAAKRPGKETIKVTSGSSIQVTTEPETTTPVEEETTTEPETTTPVEEETTTEPETTTPVEEETTTEPETTAPVETTTPAPTWKVEVLPYVKADPLPKTGDNSLTLIMICLMVMSMALVVLIYDVATKKKATPVEEISENAEKEVVEEVATTTEKNIEVVNIFEAIIASVVTVVNVLKAFVVFSETTTTNGKNPTCNIVGRDAIYPEARGGDAALRK